MSLTRINANLLTNTYILTASVSNQVNTATTLAQAAFNAANTSTFNDTIYANKQIFVGYNGSNSAASLMLSGNNTQGGTNYFDFLKANNTSSGATNSSKWFRVDNTGSLQIINNAYTNTLMNLTDTGNVAIAGTMSASNLNGPAFAYGQDPGASAQIITSGSLQKVTFTLKDYDTNNNFASSKFTPTVPGYYQFNSTVRLDNGGPGTGECMIVLYKNGTEYHRGWNSSGTDFASANWWSMSVNCQAYANGSTDYFEIYVQQTSGANRYVTRGANLSWFNGCMIRGA